MKIEERLRKLMEAKSGSVNAFATAAGFAQSSTVYSVLERGMMKAQIGTMIKICQCLGISLDELGDGKIVSREKLDLTPAEVELIKVYRQLDERGQRAVEDTAKREYDYAKAAFGEESQSATGDN